MLSHNLQHDQKQIQHALRGFAAGQMPETTGMSREIQEILQGIHQDLFDPDLSLKSLRVRYRIRDNNISSRFRHAVGTILQKYIESLRMAAAERLLDRTDVGVLDIATAIGYDHYQTFYRAFQRKFCCPPGRYREGLAGEQKQELEVVDLFDDLEAFELGDRPNLMDRCLYRILPPILRPGADVTILKRTS